MIPLSKNLTSSVLLNEEYQKRVNSNNRYSKRAYAKDMGISPTMANYILGGERVLSKSKAIIVGRNLGLSESRFQLLTNLVIVEGNHSETEKENARARIKKLIPSRPPKS